VLECLNFAASQASKWFDMQYKVIPDAASAQAHNRKNVESISPFIIPNVTWRSYYDIYIFGSDLSFPRTKFIGAYY
jgi:hypothetical protein